MKKRKTKLILLVLLCFTATSLVVLSSQKSVWETWYLKKIQSPSKSDQLEAAEKLGDLHSLKAVSKLLDLTSSTMESDFDFEDHSIQVDLLVWRAHRDRLAKLFVETEKLNRMRMAKISGTKFERKNETLTNPVLNPKFLLEGPTELLSCVRLGFKSLAKEADRFWPTLMKSNQLLLKSEHPELKILISALLSIKSKHSAAFHVRLHTEIKNSKWQHRWLSLILLEDASYLPDHILEDVKNLIAEENSLVSLQALRIYQKHAPKDQKK